MIPNCKGCNEEYTMACDCVEEGFHIATMKGREFIGRGHLCILIVDDNGDYIIK